MHARPQCTPHFRSAAISAKRCQERDAYCGEWRGDGQGGGIDFVVVKCSLMARPGTCVGQYMNEPTETTEAEDELGLKGLARRHDTMRPERRCPSLLSCPKYRIGGLMASRRTSDEEGTFASLRLESVALLRCTCIGMKRDLGRVSSFRVR
jgi:hypothetical protein